MRWKMSRAYVALLAVTVGVLCACILMMIAGVDDRTTLVVLDSALAASAAWLVTILLDSTFSGRIGRLHSFRARAAVGFLVWACLAGTLIMLGDTRMMKALLVLSLMLMFVKKRLIHHKPTSTTNPPAV